MRILKSAASIILCGLGVASAVVLLASYGEPKSAAIVAFLMVD